MQIWPRAWAACALSFLGVCSAVHAQERFTIAVIPDTQTYVNYEHQRAAGAPFDAGEQFIAQMRFIGQNAKSNGGDIIFATHLGDIWYHWPQAFDPDHDARGVERIAGSGETFLRPESQEIEMSTVRRAFAEIAGKLPFSVTVGNHDVDAIWLVPETLGRDRNWPTAMAHFGGLNKFRSVFGSQSDFFRDQSWYVASHDGGGDSAQIFEAGGYRFLHISLQTDAPDASLKWAARTIERFPELPTIISTHHFLNHAGEHNLKWDSHVVDAQDNNPQMIWDKFVSQHDQIFLVLSGHHATNARRTDANRYGHKVYQLMSNYQNRKQSLVDSGPADYAAASHGVGDGWLRLLQFDFGSAVPQLHVRTYSAHYNKFSTDIPRYADWYRLSDNAANANLSDREFGDRDDFKIDLDDFRARFGSPSPIQSRTEQAVP